MIFQRMNPAAWPGGWPAALILAALGVLWWSPSGGLTQAILAGTGLVGLWNYRKVWAAWKNPAGICFLLGGGWAALSLLWSFLPAGSARDLARWAPVALTVLALPVVLDRPGRIWLALTGSAVILTARLALDLARLYSALGHTYLFSYSRFQLPYLYTHPNVSSMMAGLCVLILAVRLLAGTPRAIWKALLILGLAINLAYLLVMASRGPQVAFAAVILVVPVLIAPGWRTRLAALGLAILLGIGLWQGAHRLNPRFGDDTMKNFNRRDTIWGHVSMLVEEKPALGYGFGKRVFRAAVYDHPEQRPPRGPIEYPHTHSYWLMIYFQGGTVALALWGLAWFLLEARLARFSVRSARLESTGGARMRTQLLPALLLSGTVFVLIYGIVDYPDHAIRHAQFYLAGLAMALTRLPVAGNPVPE